MGAAAQWLGRAAVAVAGSAAGVGFAGRTRFSVGPLQGRARVTVGRGGTVVGVPPLGRARLRTHRGPLQLRATVTALDPAAASELLAAPSPNGSTEDPADVVGRLVTSSARSAGIRLAARGAVGGLAGAAAASALAFGRGRDVAAGTAISTGALAGAAARAAATRRSDAWRDPELTGLLAHVPRVLGELRGLPGRMHRYRRQLTDLLETTGRLHNRLAHLPEAPDPDAIRLLHVSDLHLNPAGLDLVEALVAEYAVDAVVDTGDLVDWGSAAEQRAIERLGRLAVPYVYVRGNHDSTGTAAFVRDQPNSVVLDGGRPVEVAGVRFAGIGDPRFTPDKRTDDDEADPARLTKAGHALAEAIRDGDAGGVDVALVHDPASAPPLAGVVPLVLAGHTHRRRAARLGETLLMVQGSTGGAGLRGVQAEPPTPLTATVLHLSRSTKRLEAADEITVAGLGSTQVSVIRRTPADLPVDNRSAAPPDALTV